MMFIASAGTHRKKRKRIHTLSISVCQIYCLFSPRETRYRINRSRADKLYVQLLAWLTARSRYRTQDCTQAMAAETLGVSIYTLSSAVKQSTGGRYNDIVNSLRLRDACEMLSDTDCNKMTAEEIGLTVGFASRQAFYLAFSRHHSVTPQQYRALHSDL